MVSILTDDLVTPDHNKQYKTMPAFKSMEIGEERIRKLTRLYYSNPKIQACLVAFGQQREIVPRYFEGFGKRPDTLQYPSDIINLVNKGATSFHASEEIWNDPLALSTELSSGEMNAMRKSWDLLIDIDSDYLDFSKIAAKLLIEWLEYYGIRNYGIKYSGSKGFHIIVPGEAFPEMLDGRNMKEMFPEWPRAICEFLMEKIKPRFSREAHGIANMNALEIRTNKKKEELLEITCPQCGKPVKKDKWITLKCDYCSNETKLKESVIAKKKVLRCGNCSSFMNRSKEEEFFECLDCKISNIEKMGNESKSNVKYTKDAMIDDAIEMSRGLRKEETGKFDLVLVAPRHLFRMPYSLHEKTALASIVLTKDEIESFTPRDADPLNVEIREYLPKTERDEGRRLLTEALKWKKEKTLEEDRSASERYSNSDKNYEDIDPAKISEGMYPEPIKKLLLGLNEGRKRGLFILISLFRSLGFSEDYVAKKVYEWNEKNTPPLKTGYIKTQLEWHFRQKRKILPPNYSSESFYKDLGLLEKKPDAKNPIVEVLRKLRKKG